MAQQQNNYFTNMIRRYNSPDIIPMLKPEQIQKSAKDRIFKEMIRGQIDYAEFGKYFLDSKFIENLIIAADNELKNNTVVYSALTEYDFNHPGDPLVVHNRTKHYNLLSIYSILLDRLSNTKFSGDVGYLIDISAVLNNYRNQF